MPELDTVVNSIITNYFGEICTEIENTVVRTARNPTIVLISDFSVGVIDEQCRLVTATEGAPVHLGAIDKTVKKMVEKLGSIKRGDILITNDPYETANTHKPDFTMVIPVFSDEEDQNDSPLLYLSLRVDQADIGAKDPTRVPVDVENSYNEGLLIPPNKIVREGEVNEPLFDLITRNTRIEEMLRGDLSAMVAGLRNGRKRSKDLIKKYGAEAVIDTTSRIINSSGEYASEFARNLPDGIYYGESSTDSNTATESPVQVKVAVRIDGDDVTFDLSESDEQVAAPINNTISTTHAAVNTIWYISMDPEFKFNAGCTIPLEIVAPEGTVVNPTFPAPVGYATDGATLVMEACLDAFAEIHPKKTPADWSRWVRPLTITGTDPKTEEEYWTSSAATMGGAGAIWGQDGANLIGAIIALGGIVSEDPEMLEAANPLSFQEMEIRTDSGGAGRWRGGLGPTVSLSPEDHHSVFTIGGDFGQRSPPKGRQGGLTGDPVRVYRESDETTEEFDRAWIYIDLDGNDKYIQRGGGGGGVGDPYERPREKVREDVKNEYVSIEAAKNEYGVVLDPETLEINNQMTEHIRGGDDNE